MLAPNLVAPVLAVPTERASAAVRRDAAWQPSQGAVTVLRSIVARLAISTVGDMVTERPAPLWPSCAMRAGTPHAGKRRRIELTQFFAQPPEKLFSYSWCCLYLGVQRTRALAVNKTLVFCLLH